MGTDRKRIADALYMLEAGADPDVFLRTLRAYVLQHTTTPEQVTELLRDLAAVNPLTVQVGIRALVEKPPKQKRKRPRKGTTKARA